MIANTPLKLQFFYLCKFQVSFPINQFIFYAGEVENKKKCKICLDDKSINPIQRYPTIIYFVERRKEYFVAFACGKMDQVGSSFRGREC